MKLSPFEAAPEGLVTVTLALVAAAIRLAGTVAFTRVVLTYVVASHVVFQ